MLWMSDSSTGDEFMDFNRSTVKDSPLSLLNMVQRGGTEDWKVLYEKCRDFQIARDLAHLLLLGDPDLMASLKVWKFLLEDLHPELKIPLSHESPAES